MDRYRSGHNGPDSKSGSLARGSWVRIPPCPPYVKISAPGRGFLHKRGWDSNRGLLAACRGHAATRGGPPAGGESHPVRQKRSPRHKAGASLLEYLEGIRTGAVVNGAPGALQSRDPASAAAEVESLHSDQSLDASSGVSRFCFRGRVWFFVIWYFMTMV